MGAKELVILLVCSTVLVCIELVLNTKDFNPQADFQDVVRQAAMQVGAAASRSAVPAGVLISEAAASEVEQTDSVMAAGAVKDLTRKLREAAFRANGGKPVEPLTETVRNEWHKNNPCMSREKLPLRYAARKFVKDLNVSAAWEAVFLEYEILHRTCTTKVQLNISHSDLHKRNTTSGCDYLVCEPTAMSGLGNRILSAASCMIYAVLTQRVLLLPSSSLLAQVMCEPFEGSSWKVNEASIDIPVLSKFWASTDQFLSAVDSSMGSLLKDTLIPNRAIKLHATDFTAELRFHPDKRFFCGTEQNLLRGVTWLYLTSNQYFLPKLFLIPKFRTALEALFPTRMVLTHMLRYSILPGDVVWQRVEQVHEMQPDRTDRRLGVQIRTNRQFQELHLALEAQIKQCALDNELLPQLGLAASDLNKSSQSTNHSSTEESIPAVQSVVESSDNVNRTTVFIASLYNDFELSLRSDYLRNPPANGENVTVVQLSNRLEQTLNSREEDEQALTEIILLSLCDDIIVTPSSTFGGVAKAYGALLPWVIETQSNDVGCVRGPTVDACYGVPARYLSCLYDDPELRGRSVVDVLPYLKDCFPGEIVGGIQVMTLQ
jgi:xyloglucan fucosyltransferase